MPLPMAKYSLTTEGSPRKKGSGGGRSSRAEESGGFLSNGAVQKIAIPLGVVALMYLGWSMWRGNDSDALAADSSTIWFIDDQGNTFQQKMEIGQAEFTSPKTGKPAYPAELCFWTRDGKSKGDATKVLLNRYKGIDGPTFCPDCGRLVTDHNPHPVPGVDVRVPPTKAEYDAGKRR